jgi:rhomboid protease GluP
VHISYNSPVILTFALLSALQLFLSKLTHGVSDAFFVPLYGFHLFSPSTWPPLALYVLAHASVNHFMSNMMLILLVGPVVEERYGSSTLLTMVVVTALCTSCIHMLWSPAVIVGSSGIAFMLITLAAMGNLRDGVVPLTFVLVAALYVSTELLSSLQPSNVSHFAHLFGGFMGLVLGLMCRVRIQQ